VLGEFYWRVAREQRSFNTDYEGTGANAAKRLNREMVGTEVTWSAGETLDAATVAAAFRLPPDKRAAMQRDATPASGGMSTLVKLAIVVAVVLLLLLLISRCSQDDCDPIRTTFGEASNEYQQCRRTSHGSGGFWRTNGGSFGGYSSGGGGHK
jgi:uncharacterized membrane protein YgcG